MDGITTRQLRRTATTGAVVIMNQLVLVLHRTDHLPRRAVGPAKLAVRIIGTEQSAYRVVIVFGNQLIYSLTTAQFLPLRQQFTFGITTVGNTGYRQNFAVYVAVFFALNQMARNIVLVALYPAVEANFFNQALVAIVFQLVTFAIFVG